MALLTARQEKIDIWQSSIAALRGTDISVSSGARGSVHEPRTHNRTPLNTRMILFSLATWKILRSPPANMV